ncbi:MAG: thiamine phosphate synthase [Butyribacter sp.]|nr:thiamine phosphate synthase [bacterium]MDY3853591.1 thiamine phosphate synthase [Butyribacter sp.]
MCKLIVVTNRKLCRENFLDRIEMLCRIGVDAIVLREKDMTEEAYTALAEKVLAVCQPYATDCVLHHFVASARKLGEKRVHLSIPDLQKHQEETADFALRGASVHSVEQLKVAEDCYADYVFYGHIFPTDCKKGVPARGITGLKTICSQTAMPVYAIGGISRGNAKETILAGASGVCIMSLGMQAEKEELKAFVQYCHEMDLSFSTEKNQ